MRAIDLPDDILRATQQFGFMDDFLFEDTAQWTTTATDSGTSAIADAAGGIMVLAASDGTPVDNDEIYFSTIEQVRIAANKPFIIGASIQFTEAATNAANVLFGCMNAVAANALQDNGLGPAANFSGAAFFKVDGSRNWRVIYSDGTTQTIAELTEVNSLRKQAELSGVAVYQHLSIDVIPKTSTLVDVIFKIDGSTVFKMLDRTFASATEASVVLGLKAGTAAAQTMNSDYAYLCARR